MTTSQRIFLMADLWPAACRAQGWNEQDRELRLNVLTEAVGRPLASANDIDAKGEFDAVKAHLRLLANRLQGAMESDDPNIGRARRLRRKLIDIVRCLNLYADGEAIARRIIADGTRWAGAERAAFEEMPLTRIIEALDASTRYERSERTGRLEPKLSRLDQVIRTLSRELNGRRGWRNRAGDSLHDMYLKAGLECPCRECSMWKVEVRTQAEEVPELDPEMVPF